MNMNVLIDPDRIITVAVDVQNDFCPDGALAVEQGNEVVAPLNRVMEHTRKIGGIVVATRDWHPEKTPHFDTWPVHCVADTEGAAFHPDLDIQPTDIIISKGTGQTDGYSGFEGQAQDGTTLESLIMPTLRERVVVLIGGLATDYCIKATAKNAASLANINNIHSGTGQLDIYVITDAIKAVNLQLSDEENAKKEMRNAGVMFVTSAELVG